MRRLWRIFIRTASIFSLFAIAGGMILAFIVLLFLNRGLPSTDSLLKYEPSTVTEVYSEQGDVFAEFYNERRYVVAELPEKLKEAFIAAEDASFFYHKGIDFVGILRAAYVNALAGRSRQGASTITQQVARAFLLSPEKTYTRKIKEAILAWQIEKSLSKDQILFLYLNHIYLGSGAYGVEAAAKRYFGKSVAQLTLAESALLAGLPQSPHKYSPARNPDRAKRRQLYVLRQMLKDNFITQEEHDQAVSETVHIEPAHNVTKEVAPYFAEYIRKYIMDKYGSKEILSDGFKVYTTLDLDMTRYAQNAVRKGLSDLEKRQGYRGPLKKLKAEDATSYFKDRDFEERDDETVVPAQNLEVSLTEAKNAGKILMKPPRIMEPGDWIEGIVRTVDDTKGIALVEYAPGYRAQLVLDDMRWATRRHNLEDDEDYVAPVGKVSDVLTKNDVIRMSVKALPVKREDPIQAQLEQDTEVEGALLSIDPRSGFVKAMIGGYDFERSQFNRAIQAKRQPGSAFKPIVYATGLDLGFTAASILQDSPITFENDADAKKWRPSNYDNKFVGDVTLRNSLLASRNITTIRLLNEVGLDRVIHYAKRLGIETPLERDFTLGLGSSVVPLIELIQPYIVFATGGYRRPPIFIKRIVDRYGKVLEETLPENFESSKLDLVNQSVSHLKTEVSSVVFAGDEKKDSDFETVSFLQEGDAQEKKRLEVVTSPLRAGQVLSSETSFLMAHLLKENILYGTGRRARELNRPASGKTGTTDENRDAWFMGFTPDLVTGVWVGYDDLRRLGRAETGSSAALPIWVDFMMRALAPYAESDFPVPDNIEFARIDPKTGSLASGGSKGSVFEAFVKGTVPTASSSKPKVNEADLYQRDQ